MTNGPGDDELELVECPECKESVILDDFCQEHDMCLWCDEECKFASTFDDDDDDDQQ